MKHILKLPLGTVPKFEISEERTLDGAPSVVVTFPDGYTDTILLSRHYANDEDRWVSSTTFKLVFGFRHVRFKQEFAIPDNFLKSKNYCTKGCLFLFNCFIDMRPTLLSPFFVEKTFF